MEVGEKVFKLIKKISFIPYVLSSSISNCWVVVMQPDPDPNLFLFCQDFQVEIPIEFQRIVKVRSLSVSVCFSY